jgi:hypothetical protein
VSIGLAPQTSTFGLKWFLSLSDESGHTVCEDSVCDHTVFDHTVCEYTVWYNTALVDTVSLDTES